MARTLVVRKRVSDNVIPMFVPLSAFIAEKIHVQPVQMYLLVQYVKNADILDPIMDYIG